jgi:hypothetical protein
MVWSIVAESASTKCSPSGATEPVSTPPSFAITASCSADDRPDAVRTMRLVVGPVGEEEGLVVSVGCGEAGLAEAVSVAVGSGDVVSEGETEGALDGAVEGVSEGAGDAVSVGDGLGDVASVGLGEGEVSARAAVAGPAMMEAPRAHTRTRALSIRFKPDTG